MKTSNKEQLEGWISSSINKEYIDIPPTEKQFNDIAVNIRYLAQSLYPVSEEEFVEIKRRLLTKVEVQMDMGIVIKDNLKPHKSWLPARRYDLDFFFWERYKSFLQEVKGWNSRVTSTLDRVSDEIVDLLGDPQSQESFQRRGLVLGDVQSGKTANYTAICNKAADTGYRVIIILAGMQENLRQQTQGRIDAEFSGRKSEHLLDLKKEIENIPVGVGRYGQEKRVESFTSVIKDFDKNILKALNLSLKSVNSTVIFVVKKNKSILSNLVSWLNTNNADDRGTINLPMLLIDDEADNASVNTNDLDKNPTAINNAIRRLLKLFKQASYVGITATPYANIFINPETETEMEGDDLFPRDFIYLLSPPTDYIGPEHIFGENKEKTDKFSNVLEPLYQEEMNLFFPFDHKKDKKITKLPPSMLESMAYFLLINGIRDIRGDNKEHRSMMIHVSRFTNVQNQVRDLAYEWLSQVRSDLQNYSMLSESDSKKIASVAYLKSVWYKHELNKKAKKSKEEIKSITWHNFLSKFLFKAVSSIVVKSVNQVSGSDSLDYFNHTTKGLRVIAIGGNSLSRGLTLEGLCVSNFYRKSQMYDTLLQMGRWFGYRPEYDDLFKIWISDEAIDWFGYITVAATELKLEISKMNRENKTPINFGLKVRQDPKSLIATARNKMRSGRMVKFPVNISGHLLETPRLMPDTKSLESNAKIFKEFVKKLDKIGKLTPQNKARYFWKNVAKDEIEQLLRNFTTHPWHWSFQGEAIADFVRDNMNEMDWDVVLVEGSAPTYYTELYSGENPLPMKPERRTILATKEQISISGTKVRVGSGGATSIGLTKEEKIQAEEIFRANNPKASSIPDSAYLIENRAPILFLHVIAVDRDSKDKYGNKRTMIDKGYIIPEYLFALGAGFPSMGQAQKTANYVVNQVEWQNYCDFNEEVEE